jgi:hypothetical protein
MKPERMSHSWVNELPTEKILLNNRSNYGFNYQRSLYSLSLPIYLNSRIVNISGTLRANFGSTGISQGKGEKVDGWMGG